VPCRTAGVLTPWERRASIDVQARHPAPSAAWAPGANTRGTVFCTFWVTGPDTTLDGVFRVQALRSAADGGAAETFDRYCRPFGTRLELEGERELEPPDESTDPEAAPDLDPATRRMKKRNRTPRLP